ncbi:MAG: hypothetical protein WA154_13020 [Moraxellaceae bacterium]
MDKPLLENYQPPRQWSTAEAIFMCSIIGLIYWGTLTVEALRSLASFLRKVQTLKLTSMIVLAGAAVFYAAEALIVFLVLRAG